MRGKAVRGTIRCCWRFSCFRRGSGKNTTRGEEDPQVALGFAFVEFLVAVWVYTLKELKWVLRPHHPRHPPLVGHRPLPNFQYPISIFLKHFYREDCSHHSNRHSLFAGLELLRFCGVQIDLHLTR